MRSYSWGVLGLLFVLCSVLQAEPNEAERKQIVGSKAARFALEDFQGKAYSLDDFSQSKMVVVAFLGAECPLAQLYGERLNSISTRFDSSDVQIVGINSNSQDSLQEMAAFARRHALKFPLLKDPGNRIADAYLAERTPEVFLLGPERRIRYRGRIDDQYAVGVSRGQPTSNELVDAIRDLLEGRTPSVVFTHATGCHIGRVKTPVSGSSITYSQHVKPLLERHCVECHRKGEIAPFSLTDLDDVTGWAEMIEEVVREQRMPPWHANPAHGKFQNARIMTQSEKQIIYNWVRLGAPAGKSSSSRPAPAPKQKAPIEYDHVVKMRSTPFKVPAEGIVEYQYFVADPEFREDKWISAANVIPGNRAVVHHCIVFVRPPDDSIDDGIGWLTGYVPGQTVFELPKGQARLVPAGAKLIFQMHYTTNGRAQEDLTRVGLKFVDASTVKERVFTVVALERDFEIAPGNPNEIVPLEVNNLPREGRLLAIAPHMHVRGKAFRFFKHSKDSTEIMLDVPNYDFNWQHAYRFVKPVELKKDMRISGIAHFDNSDGNLANPDSTAIVRWGDQTFEEMVLAYFEVAVPIQVTKQDDAERARVALAKRKVSTLFKRHDKNGDNKLVLSEVPEVLLVFAFEKMDLNNDDIVTFDEALRSALQHQGRTRSRRRSPN